MLEKEDMHFIYSFGKLDSEPEIIIKERIDAAEIKLSEPEGSNIVTSITIKNGKYAYEVFTSTDRMDALHSSHSGIFISSGNNFINRILCINESKSGNLLNLDKEKN